MNKTIDCTIPCFVRVEDATEQKKLTEWLKQVGYDIYHAWWCDRIYCYNNPLCCIATSTPSKKFEGIDCGTDVELFKKLAANNKKNY